MDNKVVETDQDPGHHALAWLLWGLSCFFLLYEYFLRASPSVIVPELMATFGVTAGAVGALAAFYFYVYAPMQIPVGVLMDRFGARRLLTMASALCGIGGLLFGVATAYWVAALGRVLMGFGSAFAWVGMVYISSHWFRKERLALLVGLGNSAASLGAVIGQGPLAAVVTHWGWRTAMIVIGGIVGIILALVMLLALRRDPAVAHGATSNEFPNMWRSLHTVVLRPQIWLISFVSLCAYVTTNTFAGLWAVPFLVRTHELTSTVAGFAVSMIYVGWIVGGPLVGHISDRLGSRRACMHWSFGLAIICLCAVIYVPGEPLWLVFVLMALVGFFSSAQLLTFSVSIEAVPGSSKGAAIAFTNFLVSGAGAVFQPLVGYLLDLIQGVPKVVNGIPIYSPASFRTVLTIFPLMMLIAFIASYWVKKSPAIGPKSRTKNGIPAP